MTPHQFAIDVVQQLQSAGYDALWAGGCVRDQLLGRTPKDFDVATSAHPDQIRELFGKKRTLPIGAAFGVITVIGPKSAGHIEVATFRRDTGYSDGRRPDAVEFTDAREDAIRRDFTINGMFFDPIKDEIIDYVGGQEDLKKQRIRAIGDPHERIEEDKLRMLRGIRFASTFGFELEPITLAAIEQRASEINVVSEERIGAELNRMLCHDNRANAARLLLQSNLLQHVLPESWPPPSHWPDAEWELRFTELNRLKSNAFEASIAVLLRPYFEHEELSKCKKPKLETQLKNQWKTTNQQSDGLAWINRNWKTLLAADGMRWSEIQPLLTASSAIDAVAVAAAIKGVTKGIKYCRDRLDWSAELLDPPLLVDGKDLIAMGVKPGPQFKTLIQLIRNKQLDGEIETRIEARDFANEQRSSER